MISCNLKVTLLAPYNAGMITKTVYAMEWIHSHFSYDFLIRTNIGTFWDWSMLLQHLDDLPTSQYFLVGDGPFQDMYVSGTDTIVPRNMVPGIITHKAAILAPAMSMNHPEDYLLGYIFHGKLGAPFLPSRIHFMENFTSTDPAPIRSSIAIARRARKDHYRVKNGNMATRNRVDVAIYVELLSIIYNQDARALNWES